MPLATYTPLANITLSSAQQSVTFANIPNSYESLILVLNAGCSQNSYCGIQFNGDTGSNYSFVDATFEGAVASNSGSNTWIPQRFTGTANNLVIYQIDDYSVTDKQKNVLVRNNRPNDFVYMAAGRWANTAVINQIVVDVEGTRTWNTGSTFALFGIAG